MTFDIHIWFRGVFVLLFVVINHHLTGVSLAVSLPKNLVTNNRRFVHKTVSITLKIVSETFQENYKVETYAYRRWDIGSTTSKKSSEILYF